MITNLPAGNHLINRVSYCAVNNWTVLALCCGLTAHVDMLVTAQYKPAPGDYYIVTDHGTATIIKRSDFEGATKPSRKLNLDMFSMPLLDPRMVVKMTGVDFGAGDDAAIAFRFMGQTAKADTLGMREENGYVDKPTPVGSPQDKPEAKYAVTPDKNHLLSEMDAQVWATEFCKLNNASDCEMMRSWFACAIMTGFDEANRRNDKKVASLQNLVDVQCADGNWDFDEYMRGMANGLLCAVSCFNGSETTPPYKEALPKKDLSKEQNVINSLTAQNANKQKRINELNALNAELAKRNNVLSAPLAEKPNPVSINHAGTVTAISGHVNVHDFGFSTNGPACKDDYDRAILAWIAKQMKD